MKKKFQSFLARFKKPANTLPDYLLRHFEAQDQGVFHKWSKRIKIIE
jgi:hypothetical protein